MINRVGYGDAGQLEEIKSKANKGCAIELCPPVVLNNFLFCDMEYAIYPTKSCERRQQYRELYRSNWTNGVLSPGGHANIYVFHPEE